MCLNGCNFESCIAGMQWELGQVHRVAMFVLNLCRILMERAMLVSLAQPGLVSNFCLPVGSLHR
jgi:hypothetical protein